MSIFIIAEAGVNHNGDIKTAKRLIDAAKEANCNAVKFQTFRAESLVTDMLPLAEYQKQNTVTVDSQLEMLKKLELSWESQRELFNYCREKGIIFLSTPFDEVSADFLNDIGMRIFKIPSGEITNKYLIKHISRMSKPIILSTGMSSLAEIETALNWIYEDGNNNVTLLQCTSCYPAEYRDVNLNAIRTLKECFGVRVGYSDHTVGIEAAIASAALGAEVIEKHLTLDRNMEGPDHKASIEPQELKTLVQYIRNVETSLGNGIKKPCASEIEMRKSARKYIVAQKDIYMGHTITREMISLKRCGEGFVPEFMDYIVGSVATKDLSKGHILKKGDFF